MTETAETGTALVALNLNLPTPLFVAEQVSKAYAGIFDKIEEEIANFVPDVTTEKGRKEIASFAYKIARTKTALDDAAKNVTADQKAIIDAVNAERSKRWDEIEALQKKARAPLDAWDAEQTEIKDRALSAIRGFKFSRDDHEGKDSAELTMVLDNLENWRFGDKMYGDYLQEVLDAHQEAVDTVKAILEKQEKYEAEQIELEQLRREKAEREEADRLKREQEEAAEAARIAEEERKAQEAAEAKRQEEERARIAKEAEEKAARDAAEKIAAEQKAREDAEKRAAEAEAREAQRIEDDKRRAEQAAKDAAENARIQEAAAKRREEEAANRERERLAQMAAEKEQADRERAADIAHRKKLNGEAVAALMKACGLSEKAAQDIVIAIYKEQVPHVAISY